MSKTVAEKRTPANDDDLRQQVWAVFRMLRALGWVKHQPKRNTEFYMPAQGGGAHVTYTREHATFHLSWPHMWPGLVPSLLPRQQLSRPVTITRLNTYLDSLIVDAADRNTDAATVGRALQLYQAQFKKASSDYDPEMYTFTDCVRFAVAYPKNFDWLQQLARLRVPEDVMGQVCDGSLALSLVVGLYEAKKAVG